MASIGPYEVVRELGRGGMGVVYEARDPTTPGRRLALKLILGAASAEALARFGREAELLARVSHPDVVRVVTLGRAPQGPYLVTELVEGESLAARARSLTFTQAATILARLCDAVEALHAQGIVHRDLKPDNVIVRPDGAPVLLDFGVARGAGAESLTQSGVIVGTAHYMAPEQAEGKGVVALDARADVYGLGAVLFHLLAGRRPFEERGGGVALLRAVLDLEPRWPSADREDVPPALEAVCRRAMSKAPADRYASARAMGEDLERFLAGEPSTRVRRAHHGVALAGAAVVGVVALAAALATRPAPGGDDVSAPQTALPDPPPAADPAPVASDASPAPRAKSAASSAPLRWALVGAEHGHAPAMTWAEGGLVAAGGGLLGRWAPPADPVVEPLPEGWGTPVLAPGRRRDVALLGAIRSYALREVPAIGPMVEVEETSSHFTSLALSPGGETLALGGTNKVFLEREGHEVRSLPCEGVPTDLAWSRDGAWLAAAAYGEVMGTGALHAFRREDFAWKEARRVPTPISGFLCVEPVGDGATFAAGDAGGRVVLYAPATDEATWLVAPGEGVDSVVARAHATEVADLAVSPDARRLYTLGAAEPSTLRVWDLERAGALLDERTLPGVRGRLALSPDGAWLAVAGHDGEVEVWPTAALEGADGR